MEGPGRPLTIQSLLGIFLFTLEVRFCCRDTSPTAAGLVLLFLFMSLLPDEFLREKALGEEEIMDLALACCVSLGTSPLHLQPGCVKMQRKTQAA